MGSIRQIGSSRRWLAVVCIVFAVLLLSAQAMHVHPDDGVSSASCPICVSAHTSAPVSTVTAQLLLVAIASVLIAGELKTPNAESLLPLFIRPPPSR